MIEQNNRQGELRVAEGWTLTKLNGQIGNGNIRIETESGTLAFSMSDLEKHVLFLGAIGSGKTNAIFQMVSTIRNQMTKDDVMVIFDTKGDYIKEFYRNGDAVIANKANDNFNYVNWNVFKDILFKASGNIIEPANEIARTFFDEISSKSRDIFFPYAARDVTTAVLVSLLKKYIASNKTGNPIEPTNEDIRRCLYNADIKNLIHLIESDSEVKGAAQYISSNSPQTQGVLSTIKIMVQDLFSGGFGAKGDFSIRQFIQEKKGRALFIEYDIDSGRILTPIYRVLFDLAIKEALSRKRAEGNVFFIIDEFALLPDLYHIENGINFGRSLGAKFIVGTQSVPQISKEYGEDRSESILSGFGTVFAFRVFDLKSMNLIQQRYGSNRKIIRTFSYGSGNTKTVNEQSLYGKVIEDWDLSSLNQGEAIACFYSGKPYKVKFKLYSKN